MAVKFRNTLRPIGPEIKIAMLDGRVMFPAGPEDLSEFFSGIGSVEGTREEFMYHQAAPAMAWVINHNLDRYPDVAVYSVGGQEMVAEITHQTRNQIIAGFTLPTSGRARCF